MTRSLSPAQAAALAAGRSARWPEVSREERFWNKVAVIHDSTSCWIWQAAVAGKPGNQYGKFYVGLPGLRHAKAHHFSWELAYGPIPGKLWVLHHCDNGLCVRPDHLFLGTRRDNVLDMWAKGRGVVPGPVPSARRARGSRIGNSRLTEATVREILSLADSLSRAELARKFGCSWNTIDRILRRQTWRHVPGPEGETNGK